MQFSSLFVIGQTMEPCLNTRKLLYARKKEVNRGEQKRNKAKKKEEKNYEK